MATRKTTSTRRSAVEDEDDLPPARGKIVVPKKRAVKKAPPAKPTNEKYVNTKPTRREIARRQFNTDDAIDSMEGAHVRQPREDEEEGHFEMEGLPQDSRRTRELEAQLASRLSKTPVFPYPPELAEELRPYWVELVNSFPKDHFQVSDTTLMKMYCQCAYDIERQNIKIREEGEVVLGARGAITNPRCKVRESNRATLLTLATKFRNQPASRVNSNGFQGRRAKAQQAAQGAQAVHDDEDGLLAGGGRRGGDESFEVDEEDIPRTRH